MKLIATRDFRNTASLGLKEADGKSTLESAKHDDHIHRGAVFSIGDDKLKLSGVDDKGRSHLSILNKTDAQSAYIISMLTHAECIADATDPKAVEAVKLAIKEDEAREANAKKLDQSGAAMGVLAQLLAAAKTLKPA